MDTDTIKIIKLEISIQEVTDVDAYLQALLDWHMRQGLVVNGMMEAFQDWTIQSVTLIANNQEIISPKVGAP